MFPVHSVESFVGSKNTVQDGVTFQKKVISTLTLENHQISTILQISNLSIAFFLVIRFSDVQSTARHTTLLTVSENCSSATLKENLLPKVYFYIYIPIIIA